VDSPTTSRRPATLGAAIAQWRTLLGDQFVICDPAALRRAGTATFATTASIQAIVRPATRSEVAAAVRVAVDHRVSLYPFSSGLNWGYGSRVPVRDGVLLDLGRLNAIVDFDEDLGVVTIEPGVTQRQLHAFLRSRGGRFWMDATGASPDCSIIGNTMERGFGHTPAGDHAAQACGLEVLLPSGAIIRTGFSRFQGARTAHVSRWGVGPSLDGLFAQSNLGIVLQMSVWLMPAPEHFEAFFFMSRDPEGLGPLIDALRPLRMNGTLRSVMHIGNDYKVLTAMSQYPWDETGGRVPLDAGQMRVVRDRLGIGSWNGSGGLYGTRPQVREAKRLLKSALRGRVDRLQFVDDRRLALLKRFSGVFGRLTGWDVTRTLAVLEPVYGLMRGVPTDATMASAYWRKKEAAPVSGADPDRDRCGLLWCSPTLPNTGAAAREMTGLAVEILLSHGFEPQISLSLATERMSICVITISYDRDQPGEDERAARCYRELEAASMAHGFPPYRLSVASAAEHFATPGDGYGNALAALKTAWDPVGVLAPGRYGIERTPSPSP
jgi:4-cresol dehydrogenase (hydroxylating)